MELTNVRRDNPQEEEDSENISLIIRRAFEKRKCFLLDKIINDYGYGWHCLKILIVNMLNYIVIGYFLRNTSNFYVYLHHKFTFTQSFFTAITIWLLIFKSISCLVTGLLIDRKIISRFSLLKIYLIMCLLANAYLLIDFTLVSYIIMISIGVWATGGIDLLILVNLIESLPSHYRGTIMILSFTGNFSDLIQNVLLSSFSSKHHTDIDAIIWINCGMIAFITLMNFIFYQNSIRHLLALEYFEDAYYYIDKLREEKLTEMDKATIKYEYYYSLNKNMEGDSKKRTQSNNNNSKSNSNLENSLNSKKSKKSNKNKEASFMDNMKMLFSGKFLLLTICFTIIRFIVFFCRSGIQNMYPMFLKTVIEDATVKKVSQAQSIVYILMILSYPLGALMIELSYTGRRISLIALQIVCTIFLFLSCIFFNTYLLSAVYLSVVNALLSIIAIFVSESYPTQLRDIAQGYFFFTSNFFSILGVFIYMILFKEFNYLPYIMSTLFMAISSITAYFIPHDTRNKNLDNIEDEEENTSKALSLNYEGEKDEDKEKLLFDKSDEIDMRSIVSDLKNHRKSEENEKEEERKGF